MALQASHSLLLLDYFRVPHDWCEPPERPELGVVRGENGALWWVRGEALEAEPPQALRLGEIRLHCRALPPERVVGLLSELDGSWTAELPLTRPDGAPAGSVWRSSDGAVLLPFDPSEAIVAFWSEAYQTASPSRAAGAKRVAMHVYYRLRPLMPRAVQIWMRRRFSHIQARASFPRWPVEPSLHELYDFLFDRLAGIDGGPVPTIAPWPAGRSWALVLTHDVETKLGYESIALMRDREEAAGYRSSWNLVPRRHEAAKRYEVSDDVVAGLAARGFEVGVHGLYHDGRDLESREVLLQRLPAIRTYAERWHAAGFRSPATHRSWELMPLLGFDYDSSSPDTDPFEPQSGGCCTWLPFHIGDLVELPITLPQDHTLFVILQRDERVWMEKADYLRERGGLALLITHPDYMLDAERLGAYERLLERYRDDDTAWRALPREISDWWRRRAASRLEPSDDGWRVVGPAAADAAVRLLGAA
jgi:hypothetical protein